MTTRSNPTLRDVAARAGVSHQTVSRVINGSERVSPETRLKVETAIEELGFRPNALARFMAQGNSHTFACIAPNLTDYTLASLIEGAEAEARQHGYFLIAASAPDEATFGTLITELIESRLTEGLLVINPYADERHLLLPKGVPTVLMGARPREEAVASVALDDEGGGRLAIQHLLHLGHRRIALIAGPLAEDCAQDRQCGYQQALEAAGVPFDPELVIEGDWSATSGYQAMCRLLEDETPFTAVFAQNDRMAVGAIRSLREAGRRVPADVSVIGFDDMPLASYFDPPLTTMRQDMTAIGRAAARMLIEIRANPEGPRQHLRLPAELVLRHSTASLIA